MVTGTSVLTVKKRLAVRQGADKSWQHSALARELHRWRGIFDKEWGLKLPVLPVLSIEAMRNCYGAYQSTHSGVGLQDTIYINSELLDRPAAHIIRTMGHEMLHLWQQYHGTPSAESNYHNKEYKAKAASCGIVIDGHGCTAGHTEVFSALIEKHGIRLPNAGSGEAGLLVAPTAGVEPKAYGTAKARTGGSKMKKWSCGCTNVRCAVQLSATCTECGNEFKQE